MPPRTKSRQVRVAELALGGTYYLIDKRLDYPTVTVEVIAVYGALDRVLVTVSDPVTDTRYVTQPHLLQCHRIGRVPGLA